MDKLNTQVLTVIRKKLAQGDLKLPSLPDVVMDVQEMLRHPSTRAEDLAQTMQRDPVMGARLLAIANSAFYKRSRSVSNLHQAVVLLGNTIVKHTVTMLGVAELYNARRGAVVRPYLNREWSHCTLVASLCELMARDWEHLYPDTAMLAGMIHRIGVLPILALAEREPRLVQDDRVRERVISGLHVQVGVELLAMWELPEELVTVVRDHEKLDRENHGMVDYVDLVQAAMLISYRGTANPLADADWSTVGAMAALGISEDDVDEMLAYCGPRVGELRSLLKS